MTVNEIGWYDEREDKILFINGAPVGNPPAGHIWLYADAAGTLYTRTSAGVDTAVGTGAGHNAVTLDADAAVLLDLSTQEIGLDTQAANIVFAGPASGAANEPTFRALVPLDMATDPDDGEVLTIAAGALSWATPAATHAAVTLGADAGAVLGLTGQQIDLDTQTANRVFAGPTTGAAADPAFRALVAADVGSGTPDNTKFLRDDMSWQAVAASGGMPALVFTALSGEPPAANYATQDVRNNHPVLDFDPTTNETIYFTAVLPDTYAGGGLTVYLHYSMTSAEADTVDWDVAFERIGDGILDIDGDSFAAVQSVDNTTVPATTGLVDVVSVAFTNGAQMDSVAAGEQFRLSVTRDAASDDAAGDAELHVVVIKET